MIQRELLKKPTEPCQNCKRNDMWWLRGADYICGWCHPNPFNPEMLKRESFSIMPRIKKEG